MRFAAAILLPALSLSWTPLTAISNAADLPLEEGFTLFFNGKNLDGWKVRGGEALDGKTESPKSRFVAKEGKLIIDENVKGGQVLDTAVEFGPKSHVKFQYLAGPGCNNDLYYLGLKFDIKKGGVKNLKEGEWNELEIVGNGETVEFRNNGELQFSGKPKGDASPLGVRAEFGGIELRHLRYKRYKIVTGRPSFGRNRPVRHPSARTSETTGARVGEVRDLARRTQDLAAERRVVGLGSHVQIRPLPQAIRVRIDACEW